jgi:hypothetical protein
MAVISKGIKLSYKAKGESGEFIELTDLFEIPELGGDVDKIETTTLQSAAHEYTNGIKNYGDSIPFKFYYEKTQFTTLAALSDECDWKVELPDQTAYTFSGVPSVKLDGATYNVALTYSLNIAPTSEMAVA